MKYLDKISKAKRLISKYFNIYQDKICIFNSFGKDSMVVTHIAQQIKSNIQIISIMTPFKFKETFQYKKIMEKKYHMNIKTYIENNGPLELWKTDPDKCCEIYKINPTKQALKNMDAWICGLRNTEGRTRVNFKYVEKKDDLVKINPILEFTELDVWRYLATNNIPVNPMYRQGYRSLGCQPCSSPENDETDFERDGRWKGTCKQAGECGIHSKSLR